MIKSALEYHRITSYKRHDMQPHYMDWNNTPRTYKTYPDLPSFSLASTGSCPQKSIGELLEFKAEKAGNPKFSVATLSDVLLLSYTLTAKRQMAGQTMYYRSVPSAGALYPTELYVCSQQIEDMEPGIYYYDIHGFSLKQLRSGDSMPLMDRAQKASPRDDVVTTILLSGIFFRSSWKYRTRAFRYVSLDTGHLLENIVLALNLYAVPHTISYDFNRDSLHDLIGVDGNREACFASIQVYGQTESQQQKIDTEAQDPVALAAEILDASRVSARESVDETVATIYRLGSMVPEKYRAKRPGRVTDQKFSDSFSLAEADKPDPSMPYAEAVRKRRSIRTYGSDLYPRNHLMQLLSLLCSPLPTGTKPDSTDMFNLNVGFLATNVADFEPGFYLLDRADKKCHLVKSGNLNHKMAAVCLDQDWLRQAPLHFLFMSNLDQCERHLGPRGYRYDLLDAGRLGQRLYMGATAMGDGCCGIGALYDQEARDLLGLNAGSYLLYLVAVGQVSSMM